MTFTNPTCPRLRERLFRRMIRSLLSAALPEGLFLRIYWRFLCWRTKAHT
jgi:hypothetical protein